MADTTRCACGLEYDNDAWDRLPPPGNGSIWIDEDCETYLELKNCVCHSTLARELVAIQIETEG